MEWEYVSNCVHQRSYCSYPRWYMSMKNHDEIILTGKNRRTRRKICTSAILSTKNPTWTEPGAKPGLQVKRLATNRLSRGTAGTIFRIQVHRRTGTRVTTNKCKIFITGFPVTNAVSQLLIIILKVIYIKIRLQETYWLFQTIKFKFIKFWENSVYKM
jgi:hypothetical protein